jgi:putative transposase
VDSSIAPAEIRLPVDPTRLDAFLGRSEARRLSNKCIEFDGILYNSHELTALRRKLGGQVRRRSASWAPRIGKIVVFSPA